MTGWNLPPGVTENMIPGNRPEDVMAEQLGEYCFPCPKCGEIGRAVDFDEQGDPVLGCGCVVDIADALDSAGNYWQSCFEKQGEE